MSKHTNNKHNWFWNFERKKKREQ